MARCRVTYQEAGDGRPGGSAAGTLLELEVDRPPSRPAWVGEPGAAPVRTPPAPRRRPRRRWAAGALAVAAAAVALGAMSGGDPADDEPLAAPDPPVTHAVEARAGPVRIVTASIVSPPWSGVFEHHPDARGAVSVPRVHVVGFAGPDARALLVVDATRRAFGGVQSGPADGPRERVLGDRHGRGLRTLQWDAGGYGLSLTSVGLRLADQRGVAGAVLLPPGPSLQHGRSPRVDEELLAGYGMAVTERRSGAATAFGSPLIGQTGGASIEGQLHQSGASPVLVSVVEDQLVGAAQLHRALGDQFGVDVAELPGISSAAVLDHGSDPGRRGRIRGRVRLVLDHDAGVTIELSSDVVRPAALVEAARAMDLGRLARTASPTGG